MIVLDTFEGYTVDWRLREFRKAEFGKRLEFVPFASPHGQALLSKMETLAREALAEAWR